MRPHFIHINVNSLLPKIKIDQLRNITKLSNAAFIGISESKLVDFVLSSEIHIDNYNTLRCDRNRHGGGVVYYIRNNLSYDVKSFFSPEVENVFFELLLPNTKPIVTGIIYWPPIQSEFLEIINNHFNKIDTINNEIYILGDFNIKLYLNNSYIFQKIVCFKANQFLVTSENTMNSVQCLVLNEVPTRVTSTQFNHHQSHASKLSQ